MLRAAWLRATRRGGGISAPRVRALIQQEQGRSSGQGRLWQGPPSPRQERRAAVGGARWDEDVAKQRAQDACSDEEAHAARLDVAGAPKMMRGRSTQHGRR